MGSSVQSPIDLIQGAAIEDLEEYPVDTWFCRFAAGNMLELVVNLPFPLPVIAFQRESDDLLRYYSLERFYRLIEKQQAKWDLPAIQTEQEDASQE